jgi:dipeptide transport system substrate-binding protein
VVCTEASPDYFNPQFTTSQTAFDAAEQVYNRLVELEKGSTNLQPALAEAWTISEDGRVYTFALRKGVKWHSSAVFKPSRDFNADDVIFSFDRMRNPQNPYNAVGGTNYGMFQSLGLDKNIKAIEKLDDYTVRFTLNQPDAPFLGTLTIEPFAILSAEYADAMLKAGKPETVDFSPIGTGPFSYVAYQKDAVIRYRAFPEHWGIATGNPDRMPKVDNLVFAITPDPAVRYAKLRAGECQVMRYPSPADILAMKSDAGLTLHETAANDYGFIAFNQSKKPFDDRKVREALSTAINRQAILDVVFQGVSGRLTNAVVPPGLWGSHDAVTPYVYDPVKAKALLAEAGFKDGFKTTLWALPVTRGYMPNGKRAAELIQADFAKIGVEATIVSYEWGEYLRRARQGDHDIAMLGYIYDYPDPNQILTSGWTCTAAESGANRARWCNKEFSDLIAEAARITDREQRIKLYRRAQEVFREDYAGLLLANSISFTPTSKKVENYKPHVFGGQPYAGVSLKP